MEKEENNTKQIAIDDTFDWELDNTSKVFPIDYSINELKDKCNCTNRAIRGYLIENPLLKDTLYQLLKADADQSDTYLDDYQHKFPLPLEAATFLKCFFSMRDDSEHPEYKALFRKYEKRNKPNVNMDQFVVDLCHVLYDKVFSPFHTGGYDPEAYCRHVLFENDTFASVVLDDLWETQISKRIAALKSLLTGEDPALQLDVLGECLLALDQCIARFSKTEPSNSAKPTAEQAIATMLDQLLSPRKAMRQGDRALRSYRIKNIPFICPATETEPTRILHMKDAFFAINNRFHPVGEKYLEAARNSYLQQLAASKASPAEQEYVKVYSYLTRFTNPIDVDQFKALLIIWTDEWCQNVIKSCFTDDFVWDVPSLDFSQYGYVGALINQLVYTHMSKTLKNFDDVLNEIRSFSMVNIFCRLESLKEQMRHAYLKTCDAKLSCQLDEVLAHAFIVPEKILNFECACNFFDQVKAAWSALFGADSEVFFDNRRINVPGFVQKFCPTVSAAARHFNQEPLWTQRNMVNYLNTYNSIISNPERSTPFPAFLELSLSILKGFILLMLQRLQSDCIETASNAVSFISENLTRMDQPQTETTYPRPI